MLLKLGTELSPEEQAALAHILASSSEVLINNYEMVDGEKKLKNFSVPNPNADQDGIATIPVQLDLPLFRRPTACELHPERVYFEVLDPKPIALGNDSVNTKILKRMVAYRVDSIEGKLQLVTKFPPESDSEKETYIAKWLEVPVAFLKWYLKELLRERAIYTITYQQYRTQLKNIIQFPLSEKTVVLIALINLVPGQNLVDYLSEIQTTIEMDYGNPVPSNLLGLGQMLLILLRCADALAFFHEIDAKLVHRDIKPEHFHITKDDLDINIVDFGMSLPEVEAVNATEICGTPGYVAPEIGKRNQYPISQQVDAYSLGVTFHELFSLFVTGKDAVLPKVYVGLISLLRRAYSVKANDPMFNNLNPTVAWKEFINKVVLMQRQLLIIDPANRWTAEQFHHNFSGIISSFLMKIVPEYFEKIATEFAQYKPERQQQKQALQNSLKEVRAYQNSWNKYLDSKPSLEDALLAFDRMYRAFLLILKERAPAMQHNVRVKIVKEPQVNEAKSAEKVHSETIKPTPAASPIEAKKVEAATVAVPAVVSPKKPTPVNSPVKGQKPGEPAVGKENVPANINNENAAVRSPFTSPVKRALFFGLPNNEQTGSDNLLTANKAFAQ